MSSRVAPRSPHRRLAEPAVALLTCVFHLNLAFSSIEEERRPELIARCYWPVLRLAERTPFPIGVEAPGWTLEQIAGLDQSWLDEARRLIALGRLELVGSAYAQCAAPLLPAELNRWNLRLGVEVYERLLGLRPRVALLCEQAYAPGLVSLYESAGYDAIIVDWDNAYRSHPQWRREVRRYPQVAQGTDAQLPLLWSESIAFQKFQRYAHGELGLEEYVQFVSGAVRGGGALTLYANDAEVFDHRPGRFAAEPAAREREWERIARGLEALVAGQVGMPALPSELLPLLAHPRAGQPLRLEAPDQPVPVKKQDKYNVSRWAVTGRDDIDINTRCWRIYERLRAVAAEPDREAWRQLCQLCASDYRTHITEARWRAMRSQLAAVEQRVGVRLEGAVARPAARPARGVERDGSRFRVRAGELEVVLNARRGLAIASFVDRAVAEEALFGTLEHGYFDTIELGADWYTGNLVQEAPLRHKVTDLEPVSPSFWCDGDVVVALARCETELGPIDKRVTIDPAEGSIQIDWTLRWSELPPGSLRYGALTINPEAFERRSLWYATHNGGSELERHELSDRPIDHGSAVSALVSARQGLGMTEGLILLGDARRTLRLEVDPAVCRPLGLITYRPLRDTCFLRATLSLTESDDTRRGAIPRTPEAPQRATVRFSAR